VRISEQIKNSPAAAYDQASPGAVPGATVPHASAEVHRGRKKPADVNAWAARPVPGTVLALSLAATPEAPASGLGGTERSGPGARLRQRNIRRETERP
jgi:hypothetical protein